MGSLAEGTSALRTDVRVLGCRYSCGQLRKRLVKLVHTEGAPPSFTPSCNQASAAALQLTESFI